MSRPQCEELTKNRNLVTGEREPCSVRARFRARHGHAESKLVCRRHGRLLQRNGWRLERLEGEEIQRDD